MEELLESIRAATAADANAELRAVGVAACRTILAALDPTPDIPTATGIPTTTSPIATMIGALRDVPPDKLLDLAIARLKAALPADTQLAPVTPIKFQFIPVARRGS